VYLDLDGAWEPGILGLPWRDARAWGPPLRCFAPRRTIEAFIREVASELPPFVLSGSGDFHHLTAAFLRNVRTPVHLISFDNHPDWDIRPPHWACGGWINRALELPHVRRATVWGCGNFELEWPARLFGSRDPRLTVHGWKERYGERGDLTRDDWRARFAEAVRAEDVYVTVDLDCLREDEMATNWENGLFTADDVAWAIRTLRERANIVGGDICGAYSPPVYARRLQRFAAEWDHPKVEGRKPSAEALGKIWSALSSRA
jgi:arginase family enzyme